jgi:hypothetical protein
MVLEVKRVLLLQDILMSFLQDQLEFSYMGKNGNSTYDISALEILSEDKAIEVSFQVEVEHSSGSFCPKSELEESLDFQLENIFGGSSSGSPE